MTNNDGLIGAIERRQKIEGLTLGAMAEKLGIAQSYLSMVLHGHRVPGRKFLSGVLKAYPELADEVASFLSGGAAGRVKATPDPTQHPKDVFGPLFYG